MTFRSEKKLENYVSTVVNDQAKKQLKLKHFSLSVDFDSLFRFMTLFRGWRQDDS